VTFAVSVTRAGLRRDRPTSTEANTRSTSARGVEPTNVRSFGFLARLDRSGPCAPLAADVFPREGGETTDIGNGASNGDVRSCTVSAFGADLVRRHIAGSLCRWPDPAMCARGAAGDGAPTSRAGTERGLRVVAIRSNLSGRVACTFP